MAKTLFLGVALLLISPLTTAAQDAQAPQSSAGRGATLTPLRVQLVVSRHLGEKKVSSQPYVLWVTANDRKNTNLRMGIEVPTPTGAGAFGYRNVGTNIDCSASSAEGGGFTLNVNLSDSSVHFEAKPGAESSTRTGAPSFRAFTANFSILLRDGQTAQYASATDPVTGEVMKVDATLNVLK